MNRNKKKLYDVCIGALTGALYVVLTFISSALGISNGVVQLRFAEALCIMPVFSAYAVPGLFIGCALANLFTGCAVWDVVFGSLATLIGALGTRALKNHRYLRMLPPVAANTVTVPLVLKEVYRLDGAVWFFFVTVFIGELISCAVFGELLAKPVGKIIKNTYEG